MGMLSNDAEAFPRGEYVYLLTNGFLPKFLQEGGYGPSIGAIALTRNYPSYDDVPDPERDRLVSVEALFARMPELLSTYVEQFDHQPEYLGIQIVGRDPQARIHFPAQGNSPNLTPEVIRERLGWDDDVQRAVRGVREEVRRNH